MVRKRLLSGEMEWMRVENMVFLGFSIANGKEKCKINFEQIERY